VHLSVTTAARLAGLAFALACAAALACVLALAAAVAAQDEAFSPAQIQKGARIYERTCAPCHGPRMADPQGAANLRTFPRDQKSRFVVLVTKGKNNMPPWGDVLKPDDIEALWAYVIAGER
jgi:mono/diheme cytochrome c family protein